MIDQLPTWSVYLPVLAGASMWSLMQLGKRPLAIHPEISQLQLLISWFGLAAVTFAASYLFFWGPCLPTVLPGYATAVLCMTAVGVIIQYCNVQAAACAQGEVSLTAPLQAMTPGLITILGLVLGEYPGVYGITGIICMSCGSYILLWDDTPEHWYEYAGPFRYLGRLTRYRQLDPGQQSKVMAVCWSLGAASLGTIGLLFGGLFTRRGINLQGLTFGAMIEVAIYAAAYLALFLLHPDTKGGTNAWRGFSVLFEAKHFKLLSLIAGGWVLHMWLINPAYQHSYVAHVGTLKRFSVLISVILGLIMYKEATFSGPIWKLILQPRFWAAVLVLLGVAAIAADNLPSRISTRFEGLGF